MRVRSNAAFARIHTRMNAATIPITPPTYASAAHTPPSPADVAAGDNPRFAEKVAAQ